MQTSGVCSLVPSYIKEIVSKSNGSGLCGLHGMGCVITYIIVRNLPIWRGTISRVTYNMSNIMCEM